MFDNTRRQFVVGAGALGSLAAVGALVGPATGQEDEEPEEEEMEEDNGEPEPSDFEDDVDILNYARLLEFLEADFYRQGLDNIGEEELCNCRALKEESALRERVFEELETIRDHEIAHAEALGDTIVELGGTPIEEPEFDFGMAVEYPMAFLGTAVMLEDVGVSAYAGAAPSIGNEDVVVAALGIHSVEARHAAFLRALVDETSFPDVIDEPRTRPEVEELIADFIVGDIEEEEEDPEAEEEDVDEEEEPEAEEEDIDEEEEVEDDDDLDAEDDDLDDDDDDVDDDLDDDEEDVDDDEDDDLDDEDEDVDDDLDDEEDEDVDDEEDEDDLEEEDDEVEDEVDDDVNGEDDNGDLENGDDDLDDDNGNGNETNGEPVADDS